MKKEEGFIILATLCYPYQTIASTDVCVVSDLQNLVEAVKPICVPKDTITLGAQGAPVGVSKIEQTIYDDNDQLKAKFKIYVEKLFQ